jgi:hypothetical protein
MNQVPNSAFASLFAPKTHVPEGILSDLSREELNDLFNKLANGRNTQKGKATESAKTIALATKYANDSSFTMIVMNKLTALGDRANVSISPFNVMDELRNLKAKVVLTNPDDAMTKVEVTLNTKRYVSKMYLGIVNHSNFRECFKSYECLPWDFQIANCAFTIASLTAHSVGHTNNGPISTRSSVIKSVIGCDHLAELCIPALNAARLSVFAQHVEKFLGPSLKLESHTGVAWAHVAYQALALLSPGESCAIVGTLNNIVYGDATTRSAFRPPNDLEHKLMTEVAAKFGGVVNSDSLLYQKCSIETSIPNVIVNAANAYAYTRLSRNFRGNNDAGYSGMSVGSYGGHFTTRDNAKLQRFASIISYCAPPTDAKVFITLNDTKACYSIRSTFPSHDLTFVGHPAVKTEGMNFVPYAPDMSNAWHFDFTAYNVEDKANNVAFPKYVARTADTIVQRLCSNVNNRPAVYVSQARLLSFELKVPGYSVKYYSSPSPHNLVSTVVVHLDGVKLRPSLDPKQIFALCVAANSYRNLYLFHRLRTTSRIEERASAEMMPAVAFNTAGKVKFSSFEEFTTLRSQGMDLDEESLSKLADYLTKQDSTYSAPRNQPGPPIAPNGDVPGGRASTSAGLDFESMMNEGGAEEDVPDEPGDDHATGFPFLPDGTRIEDGDV